MIPVLLRLFAAPTLNTRHREADGEYAGRIEWEHAQKSPLSSYFATWWPVRRVLSVRMETGGNIRFFRIELPTLSGGARQDIILERAQAEFERKWSKK